MVPVSDGLEVEDTVREGESLPEGETVSVTERHADELRLTE